MRRERQALVPEADGQARKRWVVLLQTPPETTVWQHPTDKVNPNDAMTEAVRKLVAYAETWRPAVEGRASYSADGRALSHPSVIGGWLRVKCFTAAGIELPGEVLIRLQGYGGARDTSLEVLETPDELGALE